MTGAQFAAFSLALGDAIARTFKPTPEGFEDLQFHAQPGRVVVMGWDGEMLILNHAAPARPAPAITDNGNNSHD